MGRWLLIAAIRLYQVAFTRYTSPCPMTPCCSDYGLAVVRAHGARRGLELIGRRLAECGPPAEPEPSRVGTQVLVAAVAASALGHDWGGAPRPAPGCEPPPRFPRG